MALALDSYPLPPDACIFVEAYRGLTLMRFALGRVGAPVQLTPEQRRLRDFTPNPDGVKFRVKITQPDGPDSGKLLAEADGLRPDEGGGITPLFYIAGADLGQTPWRLDLVLTDPDLPTLYIHTAADGKEFAKDPVAKPLLITAAAREIFAALLEAGDKEDEPDHWAALWGRFATQVLGMSNPDKAEEWEEDEKRDWIEKAVDALAVKWGLVNGLKAHLDALKADTEYQSLLETN